MSREFTCKITHYHDSCIVVSFSPYKYSLELAAKRLNDYCVHNSELQASCVVKVDKDSNDGFIKITIWGNEYCKVISYLVDSLAINSNTLSFAQPLWKTLKSKGIKFEKPYLLQLQESRTSSSKAKSKRKPCEDELVAISFKRVREKTDKAKSRNKIRTDDAAVTLIPNYSSEQSHQYSENHPFADNV